MVASDKRADVVVSMIAMESSFMRKALLASRTQIDGRPFATSCSRIVLARVKHWLLSSRFWPHNKMPYTFHGPSCVEERRIQSSLYR